MYDNVCKFLVEHYSEDFAQWLLGKAIALTQLSPSELSLEPIQADSLILLAARSVILHLEFQTQPDPDIPFRMADYRLRVFRRYPQVQMRQVVIYLKPTRSELAQQTTFTISGLRHEFDVIRLWEVPVETLQTSPGLLPLAILSQTPDKVQTLQQIAQQIDQLQDRTERNNVAAATFILSEGGDYDPFQRKAAPRKSPKFVKIDREKDLPWSPSFTATTSHFTIRDVAINWAQEFFVILDDRNPASISNKGNMDFL